MSFNSWNQTLMTAQTPGSALANTNVATSLLPPAARFTTPAGALQFVGQKMCLRMSGVISTYVGSPGTLSLSVLFGAATVFASGAIALNTTAQTNQTWRLDLDLDVRSVGNQQNATILGTGEFKSRAVVGSAAAGAGGGGTALLPDTNPTVGTGFDSTVAQVVDVFGQWSAANPANSIQLLSYELVNCI